MIYFWNSEKADVLFQKKSRKHPPVKITICLHDRGIIASSIYQEQSLHQCLERMIDHICHLQPWEECSRRAGGKTA